VTDCPACGLLSDVGQSTCARITPGCAMARQARLETVKRVLREQGLDDNGASPHSWRCEHPDRYPGYCTCVDDVAAAVLAALDGPAR